jgi:hypothetical protein
MEGWRYPLVSSPPRAGIFEISWSLDQMRTWKQHKKDGLALLFIVPISPAGSLGKVASRHCSLQFHLAAPIVTPGLARRFEGQPARLQSTEKRAGASGRLAAQMSFHPNIAGTQPSQSFRFMPLSKPLRTVYVTLSNRWRLIQVTKRRFNV